MHAPRLIAPMPFFAPAQPAANCRGVCESFGDFVPPLLLRPGPHLFFTTVDATKRPVDVVTSSNEIRSTVTVIRRNQFLIHGDQSIWRMLKFMRLRHCLFFLATFCSCGFNFGAPLFAAFHDAIHSGKFG